MNNLKKLLSIFLMIACLTVLYTCYSYFKDRKEAAAKEEEYALGLKRKVLQDLNHDYQVLQGNAKYWNELYAKLTLNDTRDTIDYPKYTVKEFYRKHEQIQDFFKRNYTTVYDIIYDIHPSQLDDVFPISYSSQFLLNTYEMKKDILSNLNYLNLSFQNIVNHSKLTDTVPSTYAREDKRFYTYFTYLDKIDRGLYELLSDVYPENIYNLIGENSQFQEEQAIQLLHRQINENRFKSPGQMNDQERELKKRIEEQFLLKKDSTLVLTIEKNSDNNLFVLAKTSQITQGSTEELQKYVGFLREAVALEKPQVEQLFIFVEEDEFIGNYLFDGVRNSFKNPSTDQMYTEIASFYKYDAYKYLVTGSYKAYDVWYPRTQEERKKELQQMD